MKRLFLIALLLVAALPAAARESFQSVLAAQPATPPSLYSFADVYRLTVVGPVPAIAPQAELPMRVAVAQPALAPDVQFSVAAVREPQRWALLLAGLLLAGWVARRRMEALL
jgi:hypothetical protein